MMGERKEKTLGLNGREDAYDKVVRRRIRS